MSRNHVIYAKTERGCIAKYFFVFGSESIIIFKRAPTRSTDVIETFASDTVTGVPSHINLHKDGRDESRKLANGLQRHLAQGENHFELLCSNGSVLVYSAHGILNRASGDTVQYMHHKAEDVMVETVAASAMLQLRNCNAAK